MDILIISQVIGEVIENYVHSAMEGGRDCRLLVPGLTQRISREVHNYLLDKEINSYRVICEEEQPSESEKLIRAIGLTSKRIGSFVAIASPGQLVHIQDSIRGSGGTIRSLAFSEEWPWIDDGGEQFRFNGPVLNALIHNWSSTPSDQKWMQEIVLHGLVEHTRSFSRRTQIFLEDIIGSFSPTLYPELTDIKEKLLYHAGIPRPTNNILSDTPKKTIQKLARLCQRIVESYQKIENVRDQARDTVVEIIPEDEREEVLQSLDIFLDGMGRSSNLELGLLAFHGCWGSDQSDTRHWRRLDTDLLAEIFEVKDQEVASIESYSVQCQRGCISGSGKAWKLASFLGEQVEVDITYRIPIAQFSTSRWLIRVLNRQRIVSELQLDNNEGTAHLQFSTDDVTSNYTRKIPLRIALLVGDDIQDNAKFNLHLCGPDRPSFAVVEPDFEVIDATIIDEERTPDKKINIEDPVHVFLFNHDSDDVALYDENDNEVSIMETGMAGIWRTAQRVDVTSNYSGQAIIECKFGASGAVICFEANDLDKGEFTLEDELRVLISGTKEKRLRELVRLFKGESREPYPALGRLDDAARRRITLARIMTAKVGWRPLLADLSRKDAQSSGSIGDFINFFGTFEGETFASLTFPEEALNLLRTYSNTREDVIREVGTNIDSLGTGGEHPVYASHPIYVNDHSSRMEALLCAYLEAYQAIINYIQTAQRDLEWDQLLVLIHLDCVVHWSNTNQKNNFFLIGPWHPLVIAKRFMVQAALFSRADRTIKQANGKAFRHLSTFLGRIQGFRWILGLSAVDRKVEPTYVSITSDPGWHIGFKASLEVSSPPAISKALWENLGLAMEMDTGGRQNLADTILSNYMRAFPSRRSIGIQIHQGYAESEVVSTIDSFLHGDDGPTRYGIQLPGGVRLYLEEPLDGDVDAKWSNPPFCVYCMNSAEETTREIHPDIYMLPTAQDITFGSNQEEYVLPRGKGDHAVFSVPLKWLTEGNTRIPKSITYEFDSKGEASEGVGGTFIDTLGRMREAFGGPITTYSAIDLPQKLNAPWVVIPGPSLDPAILVKYVRDGFDRASQERALWDYKLDMTGRASSFFILSMIPKGFQIAVNGFFGKTDIAGEIIVELGRIGIAIGGETLKSGRHALGIIGLVGAVRLLVGQASDGRSPLSCTPEAIGLLIPVDSFETFFGKSGSGNGKRADLIAIQLKLPSNNSGKMQISACGIESKFVSNTFSTTRAHAALEQSAATIHEFKDLVLTSQGYGAMPERLALLELLRFGLRIISPGKPNEIEPWVDKERTVCQAVLAGDYEYYDASHDALLVSTEGGFPGVAAHEILQEGLWVRLNKSNWPGIAETSQVDDIRQLLCKLFDTASHSVPSTPSPPAGSGDDGSGGGVPPDKPSGPGNNPEDIHPIEPDIKQEAGEAKKEASLEKIFIGVDDARRTVYFDPQSPVDPLDNLNLMVTGSSGKGKTQLLKYLICKFREQGKNVLVIDFKNDFCSDIPFTRQAKLDSVFVTFDGLPYNPLIPYPIRHPIKGEMFLQPGQHIAGVTSVLKRTYRLGDQQAAALKQAMAGAFESIGVNTTETIRYMDNSRFPDFSSVGSVLRHDNNRAFNRLEPLFSLSLFRPECRAISFHELTGKSMVIDLSQIPSDEIKNALAQLIVMSAHSYFNALPHSGSIRQLFVIDEAHRVLDYEFMADFVLQCRAYGVGMILSSQYPSQFPQDVSSSMATKIIHGNERDSDRVRSIVQLIRCEGREGDVANLERFQAFVDNRHYPHTLIRTMNYPLYLVWDKLVHLETATRDDLSKIEGIDISKLPIGNLIQQLERLGLAEEKEGKVHLLRRA